MALGRMCVKVGKRGSASPHSEYIARLGKYSERRDRGEVLAASEHGNMPSWAQHDPLIFWQASDEYERKNGSAYREFELALPRELSAENWVELVRAWVEQELGSRHPFQWAIHVSTARDGKAQPHCHLMFSERVRDGIERDPADYFRRYNSKNPSKGGCRKEFGKVDPSLKGAERRKARADELKAMRQRWQDLMNEHLARAGEAARIDMRSYAEQGVDRMPEPKLPARWRSDSETVEIVQELRAAQNAEAEARAAADAVLADIKSGVLAVESVLTAGEEAAQYQDEMDFMSDDQLLAVISLAPAGSDQAKLAHALLAKHDQVQRLASKVKALQEQEQRALARLEQAQAHWNPITRPAKVEQAQGVLAGVREALGKAVKALDQLRRKLWPSALKSARRLQIRSYAAQLNLYERGQQAQRHREAQAEALAAAQADRVARTATRMAQKIERRGDSQGEDDKPERHR